MKVNATIPEAFKELFNKDHRYIVYYGGRGSAKSWSIAQALIIRALQEPLRILATREIEKTVDQSSKLNINDRIKDMGLNDYFKSTSTYISSANGSRFLFTGLRADRVSAIQSFEGIDIVWCEEAQSLSQRSLDVLIPTIRKKGSQIIMSFNPYLETDPVYKFISEHRPKAYIHKVNYDDNPFFNDTAMYDEMVYDRDTNPDRYSHVWLGNCLTISDAVVFKDKFTIREFGTPSDAVFYLGLDFGFSSDPLAFIRCFIDEEKRELYIDRAGRAFNLEIEDTPAFLESVIPECKHWLIVADNARPEMISYLRGNNFRVKPCKKGAGSVIEGVEFLKNYKIVIHPTLKDVFNEFSMYSYKVDKKTGIIIPQLQDANNHYIDALRYATEALRKPQAAIIV